MAALLALVSAVLFALSATLQQRGQFVLTRKGKPCERTSRGAGAGVITWG